MEHSDPTLEKYLELNKQQKAFYNLPKKGIASKVWSALRNGLLSDFRSEFDIKTRVYEEHKRWLGDINGKKILDLGCLRGNHLSFYMAKNAREYLGIDLSDKAIHEFAQRLRDLNRPHARAMAIDFLSPEFKEKEFDIIYAYGVLHHFRDVDILVSRLESKLSSTGKVICYDPLQTSVPVKILRALYRPFQTDKEWEWPFTAKTLNKIDSRFEILDLHGIMGLSKWGIAINLMPISKERRKEMIKNLIEKDWRVSEINHKLRRCLHVTILFQKR